jgi:short-subunit dehydrogenase
MHIFITGGTRGIGLGLVKEFLKQGHRVSYTGTSEKSISKNIDELSGDFLPLVCDVRYKSQIVKAKEAALNKFDCIDIWINNAGIGQKSLVVSDLSEEEIKKVVDVNVLGMMIGTSVALDEMKKQNHGMVYNMEGLGSNNMMVPTTVIYGSSKRLLTYFSKACDKELKEYKEISVGTLQPGMVFTDLLLSDMSEEGMKIAKILGSNVTEVTRFLVKKILKGKKQIKFLTTRKAMWRFMISPFRKTKINQM